MFGPELDWSDTSAIRDTSRDWFAPESWRRRGAREKRWQNVGPIERWASVLVGSGLALAGLRRRDAVGGLVAGVGGTLVYRGATGHCPAYARFGWTTARGSTKEELGGWRGMHVTERVTIARPVEELYRFWRDFANLPRFMEHLESVRVTDDRQSHWVSKAPASLQVSWNAEILQDIPNELISWQSLDGSQISTAGSVHFKARPAGRGTEVRVRLQYNPPGGKVGAAIAWLFGEEPSQQIRQDLRRLKHLLETGRELDR